MGDMPKLNPYKTMLLTFDPERVYGWEREIISMLQVITASEPASYTLYGIRAIGKSTLLKYLKHPRGAVTTYSDYVHPEFVSGYRRLVWVYINFHRLADPVHIFYLMYEALYDELEVNDLLALLNPDEPDPNLDENQMARRLRNLLKRMERKEGLRVIFLMDDFDIPLLAGVVGKDEDRLLRTLTSEASLVIATDDPISEIVPDIMEDSPLLGVLSPSVIGLISEDAAKRLIVEPADMDYVPREIEMLLNVAGRQPYLLTVVCEVYYDMRASIVDIETTFADRETAKQVQGQLMNRLIVLPHVNNTMSLMWNKHEAQQSTLIEMARKEEAGVPGSPAAHQLATRGLAYTDAVTGNYRIFCGLFANYVRRQASIDRATNGAAEAVLMQLAESLSPIDRGVFEYLIAHEDDVCTFEELIEAVWDEGDGTKRALEAAVHRLRRIVPTGHVIKNVRGRGYKYMKPEQEPA